MQQVSSLPTLTQWSHEHIRKVFESSTNDEAIRALEETFSTTLRGSVNGKELGYEDVRHLVLSMRNETLGGNLKVEWHGALEVSTGGSNRVCYWHSFHGTGWIDISPRVEC